MRFFDPAQRGLRRAEKQAQRAWKEAQRFNKEAQRARQREAAQLEQNLPFDITVPDDMSEEEFGKALMQKDEKSRQQTKELIHSSLLVMNGGLTAVCTLVLGGLIPLGSADLAVTLSVLALATALPLLAASFWRVKIWYSAPQPPRRMQKITTPDGQKAIRLEGIASNDTINAVDITGLWIILLPASITCLGIVAALWHVFWGAGVIFILALLISCIIVVRSFLRYSLGLRRPSSIFGI